MLGLLVIGLVVGSFLNALIWRLNVASAPKFWQGRSLCPRCRKELSWRDNIPLLSFILLSGRCRHCRKKISWQYPTVELVTAVAFAAIGWQPWLLGLAAAFIVVFFSDWIYGLIPDEMVVAGGIIAVVLGASLLVGLVFAAGFFVIVAATKFKGMGIGDVKLAFLIGFLLGWPKAIVAFWMAFVIGGAVAVGLLVLNKVKLSDRIAFGPYLILGTVVSALWSREILATLSWSW